MKIPARHNRQKIYCGVCACVCAHVWLPMVGVCVRLYYAGCISHYVHMGIYVCSLCNRLNNGKTYGQFKETYTVSHVQSGVMAKNGRNTHPWRCQLLLTLSLESQYERTFKHIFRTDHHGRETRSLHIFSGKKTLRLTFSVNTPNCLSNKDDDSSRLPRSTLRYW